MYPLLIGFIYTAYCQWKYKDVIYKWNVFKKFIFAYLAVLLVSLAWGLFNYPYYEQILNGPADQIEKLPKVLAILQGIGISVAEKTLLEIWMFVRPIKVVLFETLYTFGIAYMIFCWYHARAQLTKVLLRWKTEAHKVAPVLFIALSFIGMMATGFGEEINITLCYWLDMAVGYLIMHKDEKKEDLSE